MPYYADWEKHFKERSPEYRQVIHNAISELMMDSMISQNYDSLKTIDAILTSIKIQNDNEEIVK